MTESDLTGRVDSDPKLTGDEKETTITMYGMDKRFSIFSAKPTVIKSLLEHDYFDLVNARLVNDEGSVRVDSRHDIGTKEGDIVAVKGTMPIGVLTVKSKPRANNHQSSIVTAETIDSSVFE